MQIAKNKKTGQRVEILEHHYFEVPDDNIQPMIEGLPVPTGRKTVSKEDFYRDYEVL